MSIVDHGTASDLLFNYILTYGKTFVNNENIKSPKLELGAFTF